jgi:hypothetical protein
MRLECGLLSMVWLCGCATDTVDTSEPIGERFWWAYAAEGESVEMFRADDRVEYRDNGVRRSIGTLTVEGLSAWDDAVASVDPAMVSALPTCVPLDGADVCVELEHESGPLQFCYCAIDEPPTEVEQIDAFFGELAYSLSTCGSSSHVVIDECEAE